MKNVWLSCVLVLASRTFAADVPDGTAIRFFIEDGTVLDIESGLRWQRCSVGLTWREKENKCVGAAKKMGYLQAQKINPSTLLAGMWRLPTRNELETTIDQTQHGFKINTVIFPDVDSKNAFFWTSDMVNQTNAWFADYFSGTMDYVFGDYDMLPNKWNVRLVHLEK